MITLVQRGLINDLPETCEQIILKHYKLDDVRTWFYYPIYMPLDKDGNGPETRPEKVRKETWEVWDQWISSYGSHDYLADAINQAIKLNNELLNRLLEGKTFDEIYNNIKAGY